MKRFAGLVVGVAMAAVVYAGPVLAGEIATPELKLEKSIEMAIDHSSSLRVAELNLDKSEINRQTYLDKVTYNPNGVVGPLNPVFEASYTGYLTSDISWQMSNKSINVQKESIAISTKQAYNDIITAKENVKAKEAALQLSEQSRLNKIAYGNVGMASKVELVSADSDLSSKKSALDVAKKDLDNAYIKFNQLVGLNSEDRPVLTDMPELKPLDVPDVGARIRQTINDSPSVFLAEQNELMADILKDFEEKYEIGKITHEKSKIGVSDTRDSLSSSLYAIYYQIKQAESNYKAAQDGLKLVEENARVTQIKYDLGMATKTELLTAQTEVLNLKKSMLDIICGHIALRDAFEKPWAASGSSSSTSSGSSGESTPIG